ncbi:MAG: helix-turn-helix transcriptional regulator [Nocardiaceae bacterium]|nr:helix-turn-helix transcriptional regulator [Nocardiaceae bacterium]
MTNGSPENIAVIERQGAFLDRDAWPAERWCRLETAFELIGTRSALVLLREVFYGSTRFDDLVRRAGLSEAVAAGRLKDLVACGVLSRRPYQEPGARTRFEYVLTDVGAQLFPVVVALMEWGELLRDDHQTGVELVHRDCGAVLHAEVHCAEGHEVALGAAAVRLKKG